MSKFTIERNHPTPLFVTVDQIAERIQDRTRDGTFWSPPIKVIVTKLQTVIDPET